MKFHCLNKKNCILTGDLNMDLLNSLHRKKLIDLLESHGFGIINSMNSSAMTRRASGTIIDISAPIMLHLAYKFSIIHNHKSDHAITYTSFNRQAQRTISTTTKANLNVEEAAKKVNLLCKNNTSIKCGSAQVPSTSLIFESDVVMLLGI